SLTIAWTSTARPAPSPRSDGNVNVAVAPAGLPPATIEGSVTSSWLVPTTDHSIEVAPVVDVSARLTLSPYSTSCSAGFALPLTVKSAEMANQASWNPAC